MAKAKCVDTSPAKIAGGYSPLTRALVADSNWQWQGGYLRSCDLCSGAVFLVSSLPHLPRGVRVHSGDAKTHDEVRPS
jgi:hypothetical protein